MNIYIWKLDEMDIFLGNFNLFKLVRMDIEFNRLNVIKG